MIEQSAARRPNKIALRIKRAGNYYELTYKELGEKTKLLAMELIDLGLKRGDRIGVIGENRPEWAIAYLAVHTACLVAVPLDPQLKDAEIKHILNDAEVKAVIAGGNFTDTVKEMKADLSTLKYIISMENLDTVLSTRKSRKVEFKDRPNLDDLAVLIYTSGTTGSSKGVMLSHRNIISNVDSLFRFIDFDERDNFLSILPLHHTFEATCGFLVPLYNNAAITYAPSLKSKDIIDSMRETGVTCLLGVPLLFEKFYEGILRNVKHSPLFKKVFFNLFYGIATAFRPASGLLFGGVRGQLGMSRSAMLFPVGRHCPARFLRSLSD